MARPSLILSALMLVALACVPGHEARRSLAGMPGSGKNKGLSDIASEPAECKTLAEAASGVGDLSILVEAVTAEGGAVLAAATDPTTAVTLFAPTNAAFAAALTDLGLTKEELVADKETLTKVLMLHVVGSVAMSGDLSNDQKLMSLEGSELTVMIDDAGDDDDDGDDDEDESDDDDDD